MSGNDRNHELDKLLDAGLARYAAAEPPPGLDDRLLAALRAAARGEESVDGLLGAALSRYSAAEPRPGLEQRLLTGLSRSGGPRPSLWLDWRWAGALATAAAVAVLALAVFSLREPALPELPAPTAAETAAPRPVPTAGPTPEPVQPPVIAEVRPAPHPNAQASSHFHRSPGGRLGAGPRLETFPAPAPLSEQERLLLLFARQSPQEAVLVAQVRNRPTEPLGVAPLPQLEELVKKPEVNNN